MRPHFNSETAATRYSHIYLHRRRSNLGNLRVRQVRQVMIPTCVVERTGVSCNGMVVALDSSCSPSGAAKVIRKLNRVHATIVHWIDQIDTDLPRNRVKSAPCDGTFTATASAIVVVAGPLWGTGAAPTAIIPGPEIIITATNE